MSVIIRGTGADKPERLLTNEDLEKLVETSDDWIVTRTGIRTRHVAAEGEATSDLATRAGRRALEDAGVDPSDLDLIVVATLSPDMLTPSAANLVQRNLCPGLGIPSFDLNAACSGFLYGLRVVKSLIESGAYRRVLLVGAEVLTRFVDYQDRGTCILFGDGAGAVVLERSEGPGGLGSIRVGSDGGCHDLIRLGGGGSLRPSTRYSPDADPDDWHLRMQGNRVFKMAVQSMEQVARDVLTDVGWSVGDLDWVIAHQANQRIIRAVGDRLGVPEDRVPLNVGDMGNTSAASIPVLLDDRKRAGQLRAGERVLMVGFGAGLTWGAATVEWS
jgi:3-oxoacyl-[acyl-carrier-protein] synthase-3